ncbi:MAG TPA: SAM-dependent methyltransferase [Caulobacteraceae bacterium]|nr:SAM-dependent methyltransferase [Caulobacteraceae bacterium]
MPIVLEPIGFVRGGRAAAEDDDWGRSRASIELDAARFGPDALTGLGEFSHIEVVFHFHGVDEATVETGARRPRGNPDWPLVGIFAQRGKARPNRLGVSVCRVLGVKGLVIEVEGLDAIDGTPVLDIKPVLKGFLPRGVLREPRWAGEIMREYWRAEGKA